MEPSSRTPEGEPNRCPVCGKDLQIEPSRPPGDAPCPHCGHLLWFGPQERNSDEEEPPAQENEVRELVELARQKWDQDELAKQETRLRQGEFTLDDFKRQLGQIGKLGPIRKVMSMIPGLGGLTKMMGGENPEADIKRLVSIIDSMTFDERRSPPKNIDPSRRLRIAADAGVEPHEVNDLIRQFEGIADIMKKMSSMGVVDRMRMMRDFSQGAKKWPGTRLTAEERERLKKLRDDEDCGPQKA